MAIWEKIYSLIGWENQPSTKTPINASNLNKMDVAINELDNRVLELKESGGILEGQVENILGNFAIEYDSTLTYAVGDYVIYDGLLYKCITAVTIAEEFDSTKWESTDCGTEFTALNNKSLQNILNVGNNNIVDFVDTLPSNGNYFCFFYIGGSYDVVGTPKADYTYTSGYITRLAGGTSRIIVFHRAGYPFIIKTRYQKGEWSDWYYPNIT